MNRRSTLVYGALVAVWVMLIPWQMAEHSRVEQAAREYLLQRAREKTDTAALLMRNGRVTRGGIQRGQIESALRSLTGKEGGLITLALLNQNGEELASAGETNNLRQLQTHPDLMANGVHWEESTVALVNLLELGTNALNPSNSVFIVMTNRFGEPPFPRYEGFSGTNGTNFAMMRGDFSPPVGGPLETGGRRGGPGRGRGGGGGSGGGPSQGFVRPPWMSVEEYTNITSKLGVARALIVMSTGSLNTTVRQDLWLRLLIVLLGTVTVSSFGLAYAGFQKSADLQIRLVRASELNLHLKEMNLAAAGLAHETRNPLNIVRGLAQLITKREDATPEIRTRTREIIDETDRVTNQLNEFINYSRPREVRRMPTDLAAVVAEVVRTLGYDIDEKKIQVQTLVEPVQILSDEQMLRQVLFNLLLNAVQALPAGGEIRVRASRRNTTEAFLEVSDNGPGVAPENRQEIFKPYFTTHQKGTGLGLSIVQQIIQAHGWEIQCLANEPAGALFRVTHISLAAGGGGSKGEKSKIREKSEIRGPV